MYIRNQVSEHIALTIFEAEEDVRSEALTKESSITENVTQSVVNHGIALKAMVKSFA